jgi:hypothetical protein
MQAYAKQGSKEKFVDAIIYAKYKEYNYSQRMT